MGSDPQGDVQRTVPDDGKERSVIAGERNRTAIYTMTDGRRDLSRKGEREEKMHGEWGNARAATGDGFGNWVHVVAGRSHMNKKKSQCLPNLHMIRK